MSPLTSWMDFALGSVRVMAISLAQIVPGDVERVSDLPYRHRDEIERLPWLPFVDERGIFVDNRGIMPKPSDLLQGTLDLLILKTISREPLHGWAIGKRIQVLSGDVLSVGQGSLYPALHRLEQQGWITAEWRDSDLGRSAKFYSLTREGKKQLAKELETWDRLSSAVQLLIQNA
jgi:PadR family transcriptional regulator, regulatory protein PadR